MTVIVDGKYYSDAEFMWLPDLPNAEYVYASGCTGLTSLPDLPNAETVYVSGCTGLTSLPDLPNAKYVDVSGCTGLTSLPDLPNAETVYVSGCTALTHFCGHELPDAQTIKDRLTAVALNALASESALNMGTWHTCETTHCMAGWAITLAGDEGKKLESKYGPHAAGTILLGVEVSDWFYLSNDAAREKLQAVLADAC